jgi:urease accessory protein
MYEIHTLSIRKPYVSDADLLTLVQWLSPAFPVGGFAYSHGLEWAISEGQVRDAATLRDWLSDILSHGSGRADAVLLTRAMDPEADLAHIAATARALAASKERWTETHDQGRAFTEAVNALTGNDFPPAALPVAVGRAARALTLPPERVAALYLHAFASNLVSAAVRFVPLGQTDGQRTLAALHPLIERTAVEAAATPLDAIASSVPGADLAAMHHETQTVRIFRT